MYLVVNEGDIVKKFNDEEEALAYADRKQEESEEETAKKYGINRDERPEAVAYMNGYDGGLYDVCFVNEKELKEDEIVTVETLDKENEYEFDTNDILDDDYNEDDYNEDDFSEDDEYNGFIQEDEDDNDYEDIDSVEYSIDD